MRPTLPKLLIPLVLATSVLAHGFVDIVTINSKTYQGNVPNANPNPSITRQIDDVSPVKGASNPDINCGHGAGKANLVAQAMPGDTITFSWKGGDLSNWPHNTGPMLTYMASCGSTTCDQFDSTQAQWFKIQQVGRKPNSSLWAQSDLMTAGTPASLTIPSTLAPGNYLIRHEIIALHLATSMGGAEFYPSCSQLTVGGSQTGAPTASELVSFPGGYSDSDPGIYDPNVFDPTAPYTFPGPPIAAFVGAPADTSDGGSSSAGGSGTPTNTPTPAATPTNGPKNSCRLKRVSANAQNTATVQPRSFRPRHLSRIMRGLIAGHAPSS